MRSGQSTAQKRLGQHFLVDKDTLDTIIVTAELAPRARVLEIGPGLGGLTHALAKHLPNGLVLAIEKDRALVEFLRREFAKCKQVKIVASDILATPLSELLIAPYQIVANLPYSITSPVLTKFLLGDYRNRAQDKAPRPESMTLLIQKEVAERLTALPGSRARGILTVLIELFGTARIIKIVSPEAFEPRPEVKSALLRLDLNQPKADPWALHTLLKAGFANRRRQLHNSLGGSLHLSSTETKQLLAQAEIVPERRAEQLSLADWLRLLAILKKGEQ